jgi:hypothetical protein
VIFIVFLLRKWWGFVYFFFVSRTRSLARRGGVVEYCVYVRLRLVTSQGPPYPSRSPRAHPSGWTRTQGLSRICGLVAL